MDYKCYAYSSTLFAQCTSILLDSNNKRTVTMSNACAQALISAVIPDYSHYREHKDHNNINLYVVFHNRALLQLFLTLFVAFTSSSGSFSKLQTTKVREDRAANINAVLPSYEVHELCFITWCTDKELIIVTLLRWFISMSAF